MYSSLLKTLFLAILFCFIAGTTQAQDFQIYPETIFAKELKLNDKLSITYSSTGCFHSERKQLVFQKTPNGFSGSLFADNQLQKKITLAEDAIQELINFEEKLRLKGSSLGGCTTSTTYTVMLNENKEQAFRFIDSSCSWKSGIETLFKLFENKL